VLPCRKGHQGIRFLGGTGCEAGFLPQVSGPLRYQSTVFMQNGYKGYWFCGFFIRLFNILELKKKIQIR
jgi:hypothetical protein